MGTVSPPIFLDLAFEAARDKSTAEGKLLVVDFGAEWCGPCKVMDRETWSDPAVVASLAPRAIAIQIDADDHPKVAADHGVRSMPTVIVFRDGTELDRITGMRKSADLIAWIDDLEHGITTLDRLRQADLSDPRERLRLARRLVEDGELDEATDEMAWLWEHMLEERPALIGVKHSFFLADISALVAGHAPARARFRALRDACAPPPGGVPDAAALADWISLNGALGEAAATLAWFDRERPTLVAANDPALARVLDGRVGAMLVEARRFADAGALVVDPVEHTVADFGRVDGAPPDEGVRRHLRESFRKRASMRVKVLHAAGRAADADATEAQARALDPSEEMAAALAGARVMSRWDA